MKRFINVVLLFAFAMLLQGCISIPPLVQVQHKDGNNSDVVRRLDQIDKRLDRLEARTEKQTVAH